MVQTFDIRFAHSAGLAGLFEAPANEYRWKGAGRLSIDATGISIAVKRGLLTLFSRTQSRRFARSSLVEVYREGNALRLEFSTQESPRTVLPVWVSDRDSAAQIVTLLPTQRSVELEDDGAGANRRYRIDRGLVAVLLIGVVMLGAGALILQRYLAVNLVANAADSNAQSEALATQNSTASATGSAGSAESAASTRGSPTVVVEPAVGNRAPGQFDPSALPAPSMDSSAESVATTPGTADEPEARADASSSASPGSVATGPGVAAAPAKTAHQIAVEQFALFQAESNALHSDYLYASDSLAYERLEAIEVRWLAVTSRIVNTEEFGGMAFYGLREIELAISRNWRDHLSILAAGIRAGGDRRLMALAAAHLAFVEELEAQLPDYAP